MHFNILIATNSAHKHIPLPTMYKNQYMVIMGRHGGRVWSGCHRWQYNSGHENKSCWQLRKLWNTALGNTLEHLEPPQCDMISKWRLFWPWTHSNVMNFLGEPHYQRLCRTFSCSPTAPWPPHPLESLWRLTAGLLSSSSNPLMSSVSPTGMAWEPL